MTEDSKKLEEIVQKTRTRVENRWFTKGKIVALGYHFKNCRFDQCEITIDSCDFVFERCYISPDTTIVAKMGVLSELITEDYSDGTTTMKSESLFL